jgi:hypothetical protein
MKNIVWLEPEPHGAKTQKTIFFIVIAVKTSNLTITSQFIFWDT